ncbi:G5 domain-containing protein [Actinoplanes solisilvae]|uniref:G5 domain-containing protein n=1 Tax=Actinoplanes solisilvae TaxID=2486853 RepID=UPI000FDBF1A5|nr:G5 domain-containing protein [Actinoplanes solisilvae]
MPRKSWWARLPFTVRMVAGTSALLIVLGSAAAGVVALTKDGPDAPRIVTAVGQAAAEEPPPAGTAAGGQAGAPAPRRAVAQPGFDPGATAPRTSNQADRTATREPRRPAKAPPHAAAPAPVRQVVPRDSVVPSALTTRTEYEKREVPFQTRLVRDPDLPRGTKKVQSAGTPGEETLRYLVTVTDGQETDRRLMDITVTKEPQDRVVAFGARRGDRDCGKRLRLCVPLGRDGCPTERQPESAVALGGSVTVLDQDIELLDVEALGELPQMHCGRR